MITETVRPVNTEAIRWLVAGREAKVSRRSGRPATNRIGATITSARCPSMWAEKSTWSYTATLPQVAKPQTAIPARNEAVRATGHR